MAIYVTKEFTVGQSQTEAVTLNEKTLTGLIIAGSSITGTKITFLVSTDGSSFYPLYDNVSEEVTLTVGGSARGYGLDPKSFMAWGFVKARLGTSASAVSQAGVNTPVILIADSI